MEKGALEKESARSSIQKKNSGRHWVIIMWGFCAKPLILTSLYYYYHPHFTHEETKTEVGQFGHPA